MNDCVRIEKLLWDFADSGPNEKAAVAAHLERCQKCRQASETIIALRALSESDRRILAATSPETFSRGVIAKINHPSKFLELQEQPSSQYNIRVAFSFLAAAALVLFMIKSVSDLGPVESSRAPAPPTAQDDSRRLINIQLGRKAETAASAGKDALVQSQQQAVDAFSILPGAVTAPSPESVNIDAVYVASDSVPLVNQMEAASLAEIYSDTGAVQAMAPRVSVLITTEEMPKPIQMVVPEYPVWARKQGLSANVWVKAKVLPDGKVGEAIILSCDKPGVGFEEAATRAASLSQFLPASANGINYAVWVIYPVRFIFRE
ncbi:MAG: hypothetical protein A2W25_07505 [candidate division Zixibacteria bacterium RBG_16_53_22]|nr:MAG: hypothetical protein A2W25_07505 [candidate division Zixibacteria bacterium RBG_16_53_22]